MEDCKTLKEYSIFVSKVRKCIKEAKERNKEMNDIIDMNDITQKEVISSAISRAIDECISEDILKDFLLENKEEVVEMGVLGYSAERHLLGKSQFKIMMRFLNYGIVRSRAEER